MDTLETNDIQHFLLARTPALAARYEFLTFREPAAGRAWLSGLVDKVGTADSVGSNSPDARWVTLAFTWNGLRALGLDEASLATFPDEFRQGMAGRAGILGITGANHPEHWLGNVAGPELHAIAILFARDVPERERCRSEHARCLGQIHGVDVLSSLDLEAIPPFTYPHEHFGYRDRLSHPLIEGVDPGKTCGWEKPTRAGEFFIGYIDESGYIPVAPQPDILSRNGSYIAYLRMEEHVGVFRDFLRQHGKTAEEQELVAAKLMGRWRSGAPLTLCPEKDNPEVAADPQLTNEFNYGKMDPYG